MTQTDEMTTPLPTRRTGSDAITVPVTLTRPQAEALLKASEYIWDRSAASLPVVPAWVALAGGIEALKGALRTGGRTNDR